MIRVCILLAALLISVAAQAKDAPVEVLNPSSPWEMNYDADACHLLSNFGEGDSRVTIMLTRFQPGDKFDVKLFGNRMRRSGALDVKVTTDFGSDGTDFESKGYQGRADELPLIMAGSRYLVEWQGKTAPTISPEQERAVRSLTVRLDRGRPFRLNLGSMGSPLAAMRT